MTTIVCIEGQKGAGKSTLIKALKKKYPNAAICAPFRDVMPAIQKQFPKTKTTYALSQDPKGAKLVAKFVTKYIDEFIEKNKDKELIIFDRGWITGLCTAMNANTNKEEKKKQIEKWSKYKFQTVFMDTDIQTIYKRRKDMLNQDSGLGSEDNLVRDILQRRQLLHKNKETILCSFKTTELPEEEIAQSVNKEVETISNALNFNKKQKCGVFLARMQPLHQGHLYMVRKMLAECEQPVIVLGSQNKEEMIRNPFSFKTREKWLRETIKEEFGEDAAKKIICFSIPDWSTEGDNSTEWGNYLYYNVVSRTKNKNFSIYYSDGLERINSWFSPQIAQRVNVCYEERNSCVKRLQGLSATKIREAFEKDDKKYIEEYCPTPVVKSYEKIRKQWLQVLKNPKLDFSM